MLGVIGANWIGGLGKSLEVLTDDVDKKSKCISAYS